MRLDDPFFLLGLRFRGFEDPPEGNESEEETEEEETEEETEEHSEEKEDTAGLKSALKKERDARKKLERENRKLQKTKSDADLKDKTEVEQAQAREKAATEKAAKLAKGLREKALENVVGKLAAKHKFLDVDDALTLVDRSKITIDQDDEDPSDIEIDEASVEAALKALAKKKPHLIGDEEGGSGRTRTGSKFNGGKKTGSELEEEDLRARYPALRR